MRKVIRNFLILTAGLFAAISLLIPLSEKQIGKNRIVLADMKDRVVAVRHFQEERGRLPDPKELAQLSKSLPVRYFLYDYHLDTRPGDASDKNYPKNWPGSSGWVLWFWRGEWSEYYSSWDDHYTLSDQLSWWRFNGPLLLAPVFAILLGFASRLRIFRDKEKQALPTTEPISVTK